MRDDWRYGTRPGDGRRREAERREDEREETWRRGEPGPAARASDWEARDPDAPQQVMGPGDQPGYYGRASEMGPRYGARNDYRLPIRYVERGAEVPAAWGRYGGRMEPAATERGEWGGGVGERRGGHGHMGRRPRGADLEAMWDVPPRPEDEQSVSPGWNPDPRGYGRSWRGMYTPDYRGRGPRDYRRSDERIREDVCDVLTEHPAIDASDVAVQVEDGEVTLSGTIESRRVKRMTEDAICDIAGVRDVMNQIRVRQRREREDEHRESGRTSAREVEDARAYGA